VVGLFEQAEYEVGSAEVRPGEWLFAYTDGATDAQNEAGEAFSEDLLRCTVVRGAAKDAPVLETVRQTLAGFIGKADQFDDITMISARRDLH